MFAVRQTLKPGDAGARRLAERGPHAKARPANTSSSKDRITAGPDPIAEAEVYLAFGRKKQAIDIL